MLLSNLKPDICYTYIKQGSNQDLLAAQKICTKLNIMHVPIPEKYTIKPNTDSDAIHALQINNHFDWRGIPDDLVLNLYQKFGNENYININSNIPEIWRWFIGLDLNPTPKKMIDEYFNSYLNGKEKLYDYPPQIFYFLEQRHSPWIAQHWVKTEIAFETFTPYNCRKIIETMVSIPLDYEKAQDLHTIIMKKAESKYHCFS